MSSPPILTGLELEETLFLYIVVSEEMVGIVLIVERNGEQKPIYYISKVLHGIEVRYQKNEKLAYAIILVSRRLKSYFLPHPIVICIDQLIC